VLLLLVVEVVSRPVPPCLVAPLLPSDCVVDNLSRSVDHGVNHLLANERRRAGLGLGLHGIGNAADFPWMGVSAPTLAVR